MDAGFLSVVESRQTVFHEERHWRFDNFMQWPVVNTLFQEKTEHHNRKGGSKETPKLGPYWKLQPVTCTVNMELRSELCL